MFCCDGCELPQLFYDYFSLLTFRVINLLAFNKTFVVFKRIKITWLLVKFLLTPILLHSDKVNIH